jgi:hypothetical protein
MNERIRELASEAEAFADLSTNAFDDETGQWMKVWNEVYDQKFAELIVRECIEIQKKCPHTIAPAKFVRDHFGVEE